jgi:hypothetical protein
MNNDIGACHAKIRSRVRYSRTRRVNIANSAMANFPETWLILLLIGRGTISVPMTLPHVTKTSSSPAVNPIQLSAEGMRRT